MTAEIGTRVSSVLSLMVGDRVQADMEGDAFQHIHGLRGFVADVVESIPGTFQAVVYADFPGYVSPDGESHTTFYLSDNEAILLS